jgi:hypothetical protein
MRKIFHLEIKAAHKTLKTMKTQIEIKIEDKGHALGTLGWFKKLMENSELVIRNENGLPGIYLKTTDEKGDVKYRFLCRKWDELNDSEFYRLTYDDYLCVKPQGYGQISGLFDVALTPACYKAVEALINEAKEAFADWWENDGENII